MTLDHGAYPTMPIPAPVYLHVVRATLPGAYRVPTFAFRKRRGRSHMQTSYAPDRGPWAVETSRGRVSSTALERAIESRPTHSARPDPSRAACADRTMHGQA